MKNIADKEGKSSLRTVRQRPNNECKGEGGRTGKLGMDVWNEQESFTTWIAAALALLEVEVEVAVVVGRTSWVCRCRLCPLALLLSVLLVVQEKDPPQVWARIFLAAFFNFHDTPPPPLAPPAPTMNPNYSKGRRHHRPPRPVESTFCFSVYPGPMNVKCRINWLG